MKINNSQQLKANLALLGVTFIWGTTFVVVQDALSGIGPYYFLAVRFLLAFFFLAVVYWKHLKNLNKHSLAAGCVIGLVLFAAYALQTVGLQYTKASNAGFITGLSVILVPLFSALLFRRSPGLITVMGAISAAAGLALLSLGSSFTVNYGDVLVFFCAIAFASHIIFVGRYAPVIDPVLLATIQIGAVSAISFVFGFFFETMPSQFTKPVWTALLITAIPATSLALLIQNKVQKFTSTTHTAIIFTMEPVFAALTAFIIVGEKLSSRQWLGCLLILTGMLVAELKGSNPPQSAPQEETLV